MRSPLPPPPGAKNTWRGGNECESQVIFPFFFLSFFLSFFCVVVVSKCSSTVVKSNKANSLDN